MTSFTSKKKLYSVEKVFDSRIFNQNSEFVNGLSKDTSNILIKISITTVFEN